MNSQDQNTSGQTTQQDVVKAGKCKHMSVIIVLVILLACSCAFGGFELYQNINNKSQTCNAECEQRNDKNIVKNDDASSKSIITGSASFAVPNPPYNEGTNDGTVKFEYGVYSGVLSAYSINYRLDPYEYVVSKVVSNNVDLDTGKKLDNITVLKRFNLTIDEVYRQILNNLVETVSIDSFLLDTNGNVEAEKITTNDFKKNIDKYIKTLKSDQNLFYVFLKGSKVAISYEQSKILEKLGMSSHMGIGLVDGYVEVEL
jgi:hypothetical protein